MSDRKQDNIDDGEFDHELAATSRAYKLADADLAPPAMDDAIRAAARRAVKSQPHSMGKSWIARHSAPLSAAALVMLTVSIGFVAIEERPELAPAVVSELATLKPVEKAATIAPPSAPESPGPAKLRSPQAASLAPAAEKKMLGENRNAVQDQSVAETLARPPSVPAPVLASAAAVATAPAAPPPPAKEIQTFVSDPAAGATVRQEGFAVTAETAKREKALEKQATGQIASMSDSLRSDAMPAKKVRAQAEASSSGAVPPAPPVSASRMAATAPAPAAPAETPSAWMKRILELKQQGKARELEDELTKFRKRYPDYVLPEDLMPLK